MSPKQRAKELKYKFLGIDGENSTEYALIHVDHLLEVIDGLKDSVWYYNFKSFYKEVKEELKTI